MLGTTTLYVFFLNKNNKITIIIVHPYTLKVRTGGWAFDMFYKKKMLEIILT